MILTAYNLSTELLFKNPELQEEAAAPPAGRTSDLWTEFAVWSFGFIIFTIKMLHCSHSKKACLLTNIL